MTAFGLTPCSLPSKNGASLRNPSLSCIWRFLFLPFPSGTVHHRVVLIVYKKLWRAFLESSTRRRKVLPPRLRGGRDKNRTISRTENESKNNTRFFDYPLCNVPAKPKGLPYSQHARRLTASLVSRQAHAALFKRKKTLPAPRAQRRVWLRAGFRLLSI